MGNGPVHLLDQFDREVEAAYRGDVYRVRDNGAVCRQCRPGRRKRPLDGVWTFGLPNDSTGYMHIGSEVVHRIVATAFHGEQPSEKHIVDHIDTNRRNNRVENLRWITRLDNILFNPVTRRRIEIAYGSLEAFFENPREPVNAKAIKNFAWMRTVSKEEAQESRDRLERWAASGQKPKGSVLGEWVYGATEPVIEPISDVPSLTPNAVQRKWRTPTIFGVCPDVCSSDALSEYLVRLEFGIVFASNALGQSRTVVAEMGDDFLSVVCNLSDNSIKGWALARVTVENGKFVHESVSSYFSLQGALKAHCRLLDVPFGESMDDYA
jgi:hypothetical protein